MVVTTATKAEQMAEELTGQEIRGMAKYATDEPSENWGDEFWQRFSRWSDELEAYQRQALGEAAHARPAGRPARAGRNGGGL